MNLRIYSRNGLPEIHPNDREPQFYIREEHDENSIFLKAETGLDFVYTPGSFMGCACGLMNADHFRNNTEDFTRRKRDIELLSLYLKSNIENNEIEIINLEYESLPDGLFDFPRRTVSISEINPENFDFEENVRLVLQS